MAAPGHKLYGFFMRPSRNPYAARQLSRGMLMRARRYSARRPAAGGRVGRSSQETEIAGSDYRLPDRARPLGRRDPAHHHHVRARAPPHPCAGLRGLGGAPTVTILVCGYDGAGSQVASVLVESGVAPRAAPSSTTTSPWCAVPGARAMRRSAAMRPRPAACGSSASASAGIDHTALSPSDSDHLARRSSPVLTNRRGLISLS